jgi:hypothetical protein
MIGKKLISLAGIREKVRVGHKWEKVEKFKRSRAKGEKVGKSWEKQGSLA